MYAQAGQSIKSENTTMQLSEEGAEEFNRYQRVHQNNCEIIPTFFVMMIIAGIGFPIPAAVSGLVWVLGRHAYAWGYYQSVDKRIYGMFFHIGELALLVLCFVFAGYLFVNEEPYN